MHQNTFSKPKPMIELYVRNKNDSNIIDTIELFSEDQILYTFSEYCDIKTDSLIALDLHGVADLFDTKTKLSDNPTFIISFVGYKSKNYYGAINEIKERMLTKQIIFGMLVFNKPRKITPHKIIGSKGWVLNYLTKYNNNIIFVDDGMDNIKSVDYYKNPAIKSFFIEGENCEINKKKILMLIQ